jgi:hypothetical protein
MDARGWLWKSQTIRKRESKSHCTILVQGIDLRVATPPRAGAPLAPAHLPSICNNQGAGQLYVSLRFYAGITAL